MLGLNRLQDRPSTSIQPAQPEAIRASSHVSEPPREPDAPVTPTEHVSEVDVPHVALSEEQRTVLEMVKRGENVFFTGSAGNDNILIPNES